MLHFEHRHVINRYLNCDLAIRAVEHDLKHLDNLKLKYALHASLRSALDTLKFDMKHIRNEMRKHRIEYVSEKIIDEYFIKYIFLRDKVESEVTYSRHGLRNMVNEIIQDMLITKSHAYMHKIIYHNEKDR